MRQFYVKRKKYKKTYDWKRYLKYGGHLDYFAYLNSPLWGQRKERYYKRYKRQCRACGSLKYVQLHHLVYGDFGKEKDYNLVPMCKNCHEEMHKIYLSCYDMRTKTKVFIDLKQKAIKEAIEHMKTLDSK